MNWLNHFIGLTNGSGMPYLFWSGIGSDIGEVAIVGGMVTLLRHHQCHARWCWRIKRHPVDGTGFVTCRKHHPTLSGPSATVAEIHEAARWASVKESFGD